MINTDDNSVLVFPNPSHEYFTLQIKSAKSEKVIATLFDVTGKVIKRISSMHENRFELKRDDISAGVYFYRITSAEKKRAFRRIVVE